MIWESETSIWTKFRGVFTYPEVVSATNTLYNDPRSDRVQQAFWDFSAIEGFAVKESEVEEMAVSDHFASLYMRPMKAAFITQDADLVVLAEQYIAHMQSLGSRWQNRVFSSLDEARRWAASAP